MEADAQYLRLLTIFHYVVGGIVALFGCFPFVHLGVGIAMVTGAFDGDGKPPPAFLGWLFIGIAAFAIASTWGLAACLFLAGRNLGRRKKYWFCFVVACVACCFSPFGTVLGVFTIIVLVRPSVKALFGVGHENLAGANP